MQLRTVLQKTKSVRAIPVWFCTGAALWYVGLKRVLIPWLHNTVLVVGFVCLFIAVVVSMRAVANLRHNAWLSQRVKPWVNACLRFLLLLFLGLGLLLMCLYALLLFVFNFRSNDHFSYKGKTYYYDDVSWLAPAYIIDEQTSLLTTKEIGRYCPNRFIDCEHFDEAQARTIMESLFDGPSSRSTDEKPDKPAEKPDAMDKPSGTADPSENTSASGTKPQAAQLSSTSSQPLSQQAGQKILDACESPEVVSLKNSAYHLVVVDAAMGRRRWFFAKKSSASLTFISEVPETSPHASGFLDKGGTIHLRFVDINKNVHEYRSNDKGLSWVIVRR